MTKYNFNVSTVWECGQRKDEAGRPHQEDCIYPAPGHAEDNDSLYILCDGMGGHEAGEVASATVCDAMSKSVLSCKTGEFTETDFQHALDAAFDALDALDPDEQSKDNLRKMGTTMTFLKFHDKGCLIAHIGDSRVYHIRPGKTAEDTKILFQTSDHSLVNSLIRAGELTIEEAKLSKQKNVITRAIQPHLGTRPKADIYQTDDIKSGDYFYMCSDGMLENMGDHQLCYQFSDAAGFNKAENLTRATKENNDNHSAIIIQVKDKLINTNTPVHETGAQQGKLPQTTRVLRLIAYIGIALAITYTIIRSL